MTATAHGDKLYFAGGLAANNVTSNRIDIYDVTTGAWTIDSLSVDRQYACSGIVGDLVLFAGGTDNQALNGIQTVDIYNTISGLWSTSSLAAGRFFASAATANNKLLIAGGIGNAPFPFNSVEIYTSGTVGLTHTVHTDEIDVMPNPTEGNLIIKLANAGKISSYNLTDISGKRLMQGTVSGSTSTFELNLEEFQSGIYNLQFIYTDGSTACEKIIKN